MHPHVLMTLTLVCLCGGVYSLSLLNNTTEVHIRVYAPTNFLRSQPTVYVRRDVNATITDSYQLQRLHINRYGKNATHFSPVSTQYIGQ